MQRENNVVDPDSGRVGFASLFFRIRIGIKGMPIPIGVNSKQMKKLLNLTFYRKFQYAVQNTENYDTFDTDERDKTLESGNAVTESKIKFRFSTMFKCWGGSA